MVSSCFKSLSSALLIGKSHRPYYKTNAAPSGPQGLWCVRADVCVIVSGRLIRYSGVDVYGRMCSLWEWWWLFLIWNVCMIILYVRVSLVMSLVVGYYLSYPFTEYNLWFFFLVCVYISERVSTTESGACAFVTTQDILCLPPAQPYPVYNSWQHARGGQGQTSPVCLNNNSYFKCSPLRVLHCPPAAILRPEPPVSLWQVQWLPGCGSCLNTWGCILSGTWWLYTGAAYLTDSLTAGTAAGEREGARGGRNRKEGRVKSSVCEWAMRKSGEGGLWATEDEGGEATKERREEKEGKIWKG